MNSASILPGALIAAGVAWTVLVAFVLLDRVRFDRRERLLATALQGGREGDAQLERVLRWTSTGTLAQMVVDSARPERLRMHAARRLHARYGAVALARVARRGQWFSRRWRRVVAWHVLFRTRPAELHALLGKALVDGTPALREAAVVLLGAMRDRNAAAILVEALRRGACAPACIAMQLDRFDAAVKDEILSPQLDASAPLLRYWAIRLLSHESNIGELAVRLGAHALDPDASVRKAVAQAMGDVGGQQAAAVAVSLLGDPVGFVRAHAVRALQKMSGAHGEVALGLVLKPFMSDPDWWVRLAVREALAAEGAAQPAAAMRAIAAAARAPVSGATPRAHLPGGG